MGPRSWKTRRSHGKLGEVMEKVMESHGISKAEKEYEPCNLPTDVKNDRDGDDDAVSNIVR